MPANAQDRSQNVWLFGQNLMMDFNDDPVSISSVFPINAREATSSGCDPVTGELLLYANGSGVFNSAGEILMQDTEFYSGNSASQGVMIVPTGVGRRFFVFTVDPAEKASGNSRGANYSIVDMDLNAGKGALVAEATNRNLLLGAAEGMAAVHHRDRCGFWLLLHESPGNGYYAFRIEGETVYPPVVSRPGWDVNYRFPAGIIKCSPDARRIAYRSLDGSSRLFVMDFDNASGKVSNLRSLQDRDYPWGYGMEFSPDSQMLYAAARRGSQSNHVIRRFNDLDSPDASDQISTIHTFPEGSVITWVSALELAPDNNIYAVFTDGILAIYNPNSNSPEVGQFDGPPPASLAIALPTHYSGLPLGPTQDRMNILGLDREVHICPGETLELLVDPGLEGDVLWESAPGIEDISARRQVVQAHSGTRYIVNYSAGCRMAADTVDIRVLPVPEVEVADVPALCVAGNSVRLRASGAETYSWQPSTGLDDPLSATPLASPTETTVYTVTGESAEGCTASAEVTVVVLPELRLTVAPANPQICSGESINVKIESAEPLRSIRWEPQTGVADPSAAETEITVMQTTEYQVFAESANGCSAVAEVTVVVSPELTLNAAPANPQICSGQSANVKIESNVPLRSIRWEPETGVAGPESAETEITVSETTEFQVFAESVDGCVNNISVTVTVDEFTSARLEPLQPQTCSGQDLQLELLSEVPISTARWSPPTGLSDPNSINPVVNLTSSQTYVINYQTANGCLGELIAEVEVLESPQLRVDQAQLALCPDVSGSFSASGAETYTWIDVAGNVLSTAAVWEFDATQPAGIYRIVAENAAACSAEEIVELSRLTAAVAPAPAEFSICEGGSVQLPSSGGVRYRWSPAIGLDDVNSPNPLASPSVDTEYQLEVFNADGCSDITSVNVKVTPQLSVELIVDAPAEQVLPGDIIDLTANFRFSSAPAQSNESREFTISIDHPADALRYVESSLTSSPNLLLSTLGVNQLLSSNRLEVQGLHDGGVLPQAFSIDFQMQVMLFTDPDALLRVALADVVHDFDHAECLSFHGEHIVHWSEFCLQSQRGLVISGGRFALQQPVPNPVAGRARIVYSLGFDCDVELLLTDNLGRVLKTLVNERQSSGMQTLEFETGALAAGNYRYVLRAGPYRASQGLLIR